MKRQILIPFFVSMLVFCLTFWTAEFTIYAAGWAESVAFFVTTYILLSKYAEPRTFAWKTVLAIVLGRIVLELPLRVTEFWSTLFSMFVPMVVVASILLAALYYRDKKSTTLILSVIILILLNTAGHHAWSNMLHH